MLMTFRLPIPSTTIRSFSELSRTLPVLVILVTIIPLLLSMTIRSSTVLWALWVMLMPL
ncbi:hypothetical protein BJX62DRAFT_192578 [Aspergillus germanicus]